MPGSQCRRCHAEIQWGQTAKGKAMPLDLVRVSPNTHGAQIVFEGQGGSVQCRPLEAAIDEIAERRGWSRLYARDWVLSAGEAYTSHFATCPEANEFRDRRRGR